MISHRLPPLLAFFLLAGTATHAAVPPPDRAEIISLRDGTHFEGTLAKRARGHDVFATALGYRLVAPTDIEGRRPAADLVNEYETRRAALEKTDHDAHEALALWCRTAGLTSAYADLTDRLLRADPFRAGLWTALAEDFAHYRPGKPNPHRPGLPRWTRTEIKLLYTAAAKADFAQAAVIRLRLEQLPIAMQLNETVDHTRRGSPAQRWIAAYMLGLSNDTLRVRPLYRQALTDPAWQVRTQAVASLARHDDGTTIGPFVKQLLQNDSSNIRTFAAEALEQLGDRRAVGPLVAALAAAGDGGSPTRNNIQVTRQEAYIKDYDVEIAQAAVIADPIVDVVTDGVVFDVGLVSVTGTRRIFRRALRTLTGVDLGDDVRAWADWWQKNRTDSTAGERP